MKKPKKAKKRAARAALYTAVANDAPYAPRPIREVVLDTAKEYVLGSRNAAYDSPVPNFKTISKLMNTYMSAKKVAPGGLVQHDVAVFMILTKVARIAVSPAHEDHWIDIAGYAACGAECVVE